MTALLIILFLALVGFEFRKFQIHSMQLRWLASTNLWIKNGEFRAVKCAINFMHAFEQNCLIEMLRFWSSLDALDAEFYLKATLCEQEHKHLTKKEG